MPCKKRSRKIECQSQGLTPFTGLRKTQLRDPPEWRQIKSSLFQESRAVLRKKSGI
jgi:hypothetical protein